MEYWHKSEIKAPQGRPMIHHHRAQISLIKKCERMKDVDLLMEGAINAYGINEVLLVYDIDHTLITPQRLFQRPHVLAHHAQEMRGINATLSQRERDLMETLVLTEDSEWVLVEEHIADSIAYWQNKGAHVMACTLGLSGEINNLYIPELRLKQLRTHGIDFAPSAPWKDKIEFKAMKSNMGFYPLFSEGILHVGGGASGNTKGEVLGAFIDLLDKKPKIVILVDDRELNILHTKSELAKREIGYIGCHYVAAASISDPVPGEVEEFNKFWKEYAEKACLLLQDMLKLAKVEDETGEQKESGNSNENKDSSARSKENALLQKKE